MSKKEISEMSAIKQLSKNLDPSKIRQLQSALNVPARISEKTENNPILFLYSLKYWKEFDPHLFDKALGMIGGSSLQCVARGVKWLSPEFREQSPLPESLSVHSFLRLLEEELTETEWIQLVGIRTEIQIGVKIQPKKLIRVLMESNTISQDLETLCGFLAALERQELAVRVGSYKPLFRSLAPTQFRREVMNGTKLRVKRQRYTRVCWRCKHRPFFCRAMTLRKSKKIKN